MKRKLIILMMALTIVANAQVSMSSDSRTCYYNFITTLPSGTVVDTLIQMERESISILLEFDKDYNSLIYSTPTGSKKYFILSSFPDTNSKDDCYYTNLIDSEGVKMTIHINKEKNILTFLSEDYLIKMPIVNAWVRKE